MKSIIIVVVSFSVSYIAKTQNVICNDCDKDGILDSMEQILSERFAPIIYHDLNEINFPTNVDTFLQHTSLYLFDDECDFPSRDVHKLVKEKPTQKDLIAQQFNDNFCGSTGLVKSNCTRSIKKQRTYYLKDVGNGFKGGSENTTEWITYFHAYKNKNNGITLQYWRFYSFNTGFHNYGLDFSHGGDWESIQIILDSNSVPIYVDLLGHSTIDRKNWNEIKSENNHPEIFSERGGHTSIPFINQNGRRQETWTDGKVFNLVGEASETGCLLNIGEKLYPLNDQLFIQYSGIWGSPGDFEFTSGYWSPSYNETAINADTQFIKAWCNEMLNTDNINDDGLRECYPCGTSR